MGLTHQYSSQRQVFYDSAVIFKEVQGHLARLEVIDKPDYFTFVANGEPTLDINYGKSIERLKKMDILIVVITKQ